MCPAAHREEAFSGISMTMLVVAEASGAIIGKNKMVV